MTSAQLETGYWRAYRDFYRWGSILRGTRTKPPASGSLRHLAYAGGWKKFEPLWDVVIRSGLIGRTRPLLERILDAAQRDARPAASDEVPTPAPGVLEWEPQAPAHENRPALLVGHRVG